MTQDQMTAARQFIDAIPHSRRLGMQLKELGDGRAIISMPYDSALIGDPVTKVIHGGAVSALMDTAGGAAVVAHPLAGLGTATLDLRIDYMRPATPARLSRRLLSAIMSPGLSPLCVPPPAMRIQTVPLRQRQVLLPLRRPAHEPARTCHASQTPSRSRLVGHRQPSALY